MTTSKNHGPLPIFSFYGARNLASPERTRDRVGLREKSFAFFMLQRSFFRPVTLFSSIFCLSFLLVRQSASVDRLCLLKDDRTDASTVVGFILYFFNEKRGEKFRTFYRIIHAYIESTLTNTKLTLNQRGMGISRNWKS